MKIKKYVLGFAFSRSGNQIVLIKKDHPEWQKGKWNGVGGSIEDETPIGAMVREFKEETGVDTEYQMWQKIGIIKGVGYEVLCYKMLSNVIYQCKTTTNEEIKIFDSVDIPLNCIDNLFYLVPMALDSLGLKEFELKYENN